jgi:hypothetical protein
MPLVQAVKPGPQGPGFTVKRKSKKMPKMGTPFLFGLIALAAGVLALAAWAPRAMSAPALAPISEESQACMDCHQEATPGIVADWKRSAHARTTPERALKKAELERRVSVSNLPAALAGHAVGCAECHLSRDSSHGDSHEHDAYRVHTVVTPRDCAQCHPTEVKEFGQNLMSHAWVNLTQNPLYQDLTKQITATHTWERGGFKLTGPSPATRDDSCLYCHGTEVKVIGTRTVETDFGDFSLPALSGWPNHGVGRKNPDGSLGSCGACHSRHRFAINMARKPHTCSECHKGPDVPAYKVYQVSKHGNIYETMHKDWDFNAVPWKVGQDFNAPTCAVCHLSLLVDTNGNLVARRSHRMNDRLELRLLGLIYAHAHPKSPDTSRIKNKDGLSLPTALSGEPAADILIGPQERKKRRAALQKVCLACHGSSWVEGQFTLLDESVKTTNQATLAATRLMMDIWQKGLAQGPASGGSLFDEFVERIWVEQWLFYANTVRLASAMMGADYGVFADGRWQLALNLHRLRDWLKARENKKPPQN